MKIQCQCGAKYALDITPGMAPVTFVCRNCGQDYSAFINDLIQKETAAADAVASAFSAPPAAQASTPVASTAPAAPAAPPAQEAPRLRISRAQEPAAPAAAPEASEQTPGSKYCSRHRSDLTTDICQVCQKPICPKCIDSFGPYCSPFCRNKVEGAKMDAPAFAGQKFVAQREYWRKVGMIATVVGLVLASVFGFWFWYAWIGSAPHILLSVHWDDISHSGSSQMVGADQLVFLHGGTLARYDLKTKQKIWSLDLVTPDQVQAVIKQEDAESTEVQHRTGEATAAALEPGNIREKHARIGLEEQYTLYVSGQNIWTANANVLTHYDWNSGNVLQQMTLTNDVGELTGHGNELLAVADADDGTRTATHISLDDGSIRTEQFALMPGTPAAPAVAQNAARAGRAEGGLPLSPNGQDRPLNPGRVAEQVQNLSYPARVALPALLANSEHNRQINQEIREEDRQSQPFPQRAAAAAAAAQQQQDFDSQSFTLIPDGDSYVAFASRVLQENVVQHEAMKAPPKHSALDSPTLSTANEDAAVNEQLNDIQRINGGDKVTEDVSTYQVALRRPGNAKPDWIGEIVGPPQFYPLTNVNVLAAGKTIMVFDKSNNRLWQDHLTYDITGGDGQGAGQLFQSPYGQGPCVENNGTLYVFDQAVLTAYDPTSGNVHWRIPSVGVVGLFFDDKGMVYVNTTTGNPDDIKYSRQIDVDKQTQAVVMKVDPSNGNILWKATDGGFISYLSGKFIYAYRSYNAGDSDEQYSDATAGLTLPSYLKIIRINSSNGHVMWEHDEDRSPVDVQFDRNTISLILKKEVEVLHFFTL